VDASHGSSTSKSAGNSPPKPENPNPKKKRTRSKDDLKPTVRISDSSFTQPKNPPPSEVILDEIDVVDGDEVMELTEPA
jgi:hypothetical protein